MATRSPPRSAQQEQRGARKSCGKNEPTEEIAQLVQSQIVSYFGREFLVPGKTRCQPVVAGNPAENIFTPRILKSAPKSAVSASWRELQVHHGESVVWRTGSLRSPRERN